MTVAVVFLLGAGTYAMRLGGVLLRGQVRFSPRVERLMSIAAIVLLGAFIATSTTVESGGFAGFARFAGVFIGGVLAWRRVPFLIVVPVAAATTAVIRLFGIM